MQRDISMLADVQKDIASRFEQLEMAWLAHKNSRSSETLATMNDQVASVGVLVRATLLGSIDLVSQKYDKMVDPLVWKITDAHDSSILETTRYAETQSRGEVLREFLNAYDVEPGDISISLELEPS